MTNPLHDDYCHLCCWWHTNGLAIDGDAHPVHKDPQCSQCFPPLEFNAERMLDADEADAALEHFQPLRETPLRAAARAVINELFPGEGDVVLPPRPLP